ncbi:MAG: class I SAM-dependent methyltransferase [Bacteroidetes bacterium]|nr:class I SAM-dependent methyltransferase [Bacteroidota bacterium]MBU1719252.1 class I SAM-dependent methyltransferase [Bacteroidota bacterium]
MFQFQTYLRYQIVAKGLHSIHSPFVFRLVTECMRAKGQVAGEEQAEAWRKKLKKNKSAVCGIDYGSGQGMTMEYRVSDLTRKSLLPRKYCRLLSRLAHFSGAKIIIEMGTSLGVSTLYLAASSEKTRVVTMEGNEGIAAEAERGFDQYLPGTIRLVNGDFNETLRPLMEQSGTFDLAFIDGNHFCRPTIEYFKLLKQYRHEKTVIVFDDIYHSSEMFDAWELIKADTDVTITIDLWRMGLVYFIPGMEKQDFVVKY